MTPYLTDKKHLKPFVSRSVANRLTWGIYTENLGQHRETQGTGESLAQGRVLRYIEVSQLWELKTSSKKRFGGKKKTAERDRTAKKSHLAYRYTTRIISKAKQKNDQISDDLGIREPRPSENIFAIKRYTLIQFPTILGYGSPVLRKKKSPKRGTLDTIFDDLGFREPRPSETIFAKKTYTLIQFPTILG